MTSEERPQAFTHHLEQAKAHVTRVEPALEVRDVSCPRPAVQRPGGAGEDDAA